MSESVFLRVSSIQSCLVTLLRLTLCDPVDCIPSGSSVHKIFSGKNAGMDCHFFLQGGSSQPRDQTRISCVSCISWSGAGVGSLPAEPSGKPRLKGSCSSAVCILVPRGWCCRVGRRKPRTGDQLGAQRYGKSTGKKLQGQPGPGGPAFRCHPELPVQLWSSPPSPPPLAQGHVTLPGFLCSSER